MKNILIVDDDITFSFELEQLFKNDFTIQKCVDGISAISQINATLFDCVLLDVDILGQINGLEVLKTVKQDEKLKKTPVVILTNMSKERKQEFLDAGANEFFTKDETDLEVIKAAVDKYTQLNEISH